MHGACTPSPLHFGRIRHVFHQCTAAMPSFLDAPCQRTGPLHIIASTTSLPIYFKHHSSDVSHRNSASAPCILRPQDFHCLLVLAPSTQVITTPFETGFNHLRISDELQFKYDRCFKAMGPEVADLPVFGLGHSLGSLMQLLISARYAVPRAGASW